MIVFFLWLVVLKVVVEYSVFKGWLLLWEIPSQSLFVLATLEKPVKPQILIAEMQVWEDGKGMRRTILVWIKRILYKGERKGWLFSEPTSIFPK